MKVSPTMGNRRRVWIQTSLPVLSVWKSLDKHKSLHFSLEDKEQLFSLVNSIYIQQFVISFAKTRDTIQVSDVLTEFNLRFKI